MLGNSVLLLLNVCNIVQIFVDSLARNTDWNISNIGTKNESILAFFLHFQLFILKFESESETA